MKIEKSYPPNFADSFSTKVMNSGVDMDLGKIK